MKNSYSKTWIFFLSMLLIFFIGAYTVVQQGKQQEQEPEIISVTHEDVPAGQFQAFLDSLAENITAPIALLLLQILAILIVARIFSFIFVKIGQPTVIGEILAGIILGPSLLGVIFPDAYYFLFDPSSLGNLYILSQIGLVLFMFVIGLELNFDDLRQKMGETFAISTASIIIPFLFGMILSFFVYKEFASGQTDFLSFSLFIGISMSITAFPVLARIVQEKGLTKTSLGSLSIAGAAVNDVVAWCLLAAVIAITKTGSFVSSLYTIGFAVVYTSLMLLVVRPFLKKLASVYKNSELINKSIVAFLFLILIGSAFITQLIGIHALFGAFLVGVIMPQDMNFRKILMEKIEDVASTLFLPLFFVYTGLQTNIGLLNSPYLWGICLIFILVAVGGKFIGSAAAARFFGESWYNSLSLGMLMNTRGLMELIVLNIGYEMGILPESVFVMLVIVALVTTFMTTPGMSLINWFFPPKRERIIREKALGVFNVLISIGNPASGKSLFRVAKTVLNGYKNSLSITALHITPGTDTNPMYGEQFSEESFLPIREVAQDTSIPLSTKYKVADNIEADITKYVNQNEFDFLLVGAGVSLGDNAINKRTKLFKKLSWLNRKINYMLNRRAIFYPGTTVKDKVQYFVEHSDCSVGILINRGYTNSETTLILLQEVNDVFLLRYARRMLRNNPNVHITIIDLNKVLSSNKTALEYYDRELKSIFAASIKISRIKELTTDLFSRFNFMLVSYQAWEHFSENSNNEFVNIPTTLIINKKTTRFTVKTRKQKKSEPEEGIDPLYE
ncbi:MAG: cation:proton antiporter [Prevotellaceae bacterium]|jgi:Kef-type K+ transport system membrane component KefB|nr:cation:proton antiporter [Prevotellaceae bacterium]